METLKFEIEGFSPLMMHSDRTVNALDPVTIAIKKLTSKRKKSEEDHGEIARLEFSAGLYHDDDLGPYIPAQNIERMFRDAATATKRGKDIERAFMVLTEKAPLKYDGPRGVAELWKAEKFADMRSVKPQRNRIMRCRPIFRDWGLCFDVAYDTSFFEEQIINDILEWGSRYVGLGNYRPRFGRFKVVR